MNAIPRLEQIGSNQTRVIVNGVSLWFSYETCIAFDTYGKNDGNAVECFNPAYRKYSRTTSKHASQMNVARYPDPLDGEPFERALARNLA